MTMHKGLHAQYTNKFYESKEGRGMGSHVSIVDSTDASVKAQEDYIKNCKKSLIKIGKNSSSRISTY